jgi:NAD(P)-dependent dehydrogenase (short-subunit alcohol dehydrogenase family)
VLPVRCDHRVDSEVETVFERVQKDTGRLDLLVNNAFASAGTAGPPERSAILGDSDLAVDDLIDVGLRSHFVAMRLAVPMMIEAGSGLVVNVASHARAAESRSDRARSSRTRFARLVSAD